MEQRQLHLGIVNSITLETRNLKVLVTGATGMLGSRLVSDLLIKGFSVRALCRNSSRIEQFEKNVGFYADNARSYLSQIEWIEADVLDYHAVLSAVDGVDYVFHCAAMVSFDSSEFTLMQDINISGTANIVDACLEKGVKRIFHVSSIAALGASENGFAANEETYWIPDKKHSGYSFSKYYSEMEVWRGINEGLESVIVNPSVILGPGEWTTGSPSFFENIYKRLKFYTSGSTGFVDVRDVSAALIALSVDEKWAKHKNKRFVLNSINLNYKDFFAMVANSVGKEPPKYFAPKLLLEIGWRAALMLSKISGSKVLISKETVRNSIQKKLFDGSKIIRAIGFSYRPIETTISEIGQMYLSDIQGR